MISKILVSIGICAFSNAALACSFAEMTEEFTILEGRSSTPSIPDFELESIQRGTDDENSASCSDSGILTLKMKNTPADPTGYVFRIAEGRFEGAPFHDWPVQASEHFSAEGEYNFVWFDGSNFEQEPINIVLEIIAVSKTGQRSEPQRLSVFHPGVAKPWWKIW